MGRRKQTQEELDPNFPETLHAQIDALETEIRKLQRSINAKKREIGVLKKQGDAILREQRQLAAREEINNLRRLHNMFRNRSLPEEWEEERRGRKIPEGADCSTCAYKKTGGHRIYEGDWCYLVRYQVNGGFSYQLELHSLEDCCLHWVRAGDCPICHAPGVPYLFENWELRGVLYCETCHKAFRVAGEEDQQQ